jgi:hypothetical protein
MLRSWLAQHCPNGDGEFALEGCTGWRYVAEELMGTEQRAFDRSPLVRGTLFTEPPAGERC